jgi:hypothetical protein
MSAVVEAVSSVTNTVVEAVSEVGNTAIDLAQTISKTATDVASKGFKAGSDLVADVGQAIVDNTVKPVVKAVQNTYDAFEKDPLGTSLKIAAAMSGNPYYMMAANTSVNIAQGQDINDALENGAKATAITYGAQLAGNYVQDAFNAPVGSTYGPDNIDAGGGFNPATGTSSVQAPTQFDIQAPLSTAPQVDPTVAKIAGQTASGATRAALSGQDPIKGGTQALTSSLVSAGTSAGAKSISDSNLENWSQKNAEASYENAPSPTEQDVLAADPSIKMDFPLSTPTEATGSGDYNQVTGEFVPDPNGTLQAPLDNTSGTNLDSVKENADLTGLSNTQSPLDTAAVLPPPTEVAPEAYDPIKQSTIKSGLDYAANAVLNQPKNGTATPTATPATGTAPAPTSLSQQVYRDPILSSEAQYLGYNTGNQNAVNQPVDPYELKQLYDSLDPRLAEQLRLRGIAPEVTASNTVDPLLTTTKLVADGGTIKSYAAGSTVTSGLYDSSVFNPTITKTNPNMLPAAPVVAMTSRLGALKHLYAGLGSKQPHLAAGGLPSKYTEAAPKGHNPEFVTGLTGYYAQGKGTGQSDDIPAMLHDGDYVADADLVAALGDGSSKAGAEALEKFRRQIPHQESAEGGAVVPAKIADGEYVFPASFVTAIGRGDNKAGAKLLDAMREEIRAHKRSAPTSKIPPKAKSPLDYLKMVKG